MEILECLSAVHFLFQIGNISQWTIANLRNRTLHRSKPLTAYTIIVMIFSFLFLIYDVFADTNLNKTTNEIGELVDFIQMTGIRIAHLISLAEALVRSNEEMKLFVAIREIDHIFENSLNADVNNKQFRQRTFQRGGIMLFIYLASEIFILVCKMLTTDRNFSAFWILYLLPFLICGLRYFQIFNAIILIKNRFDKLSMILEQVNLLQDSTRTEFSDTVNIKLVSKELPQYDHLHHIQRCGMENQDMKRLLIVRNVYHRLWEINCLVNRCYGISILINIANDFISITSNCYWIFLNFKENSSTVGDFLQTAESVVWSVPHLFNVLFLAIICEETVKSTRNIALGLHSIKIDILNDNHNSLVEQFSMQLLHQKLAFSAAGFFNVDCSLLYTIVGATTTYLIILIQFHMSEQKSKENV